MSFSDIIQFTELIHAAQGSRIVNQLPNELGIDSSCLVKG
jgi:hypothetical protein